MNNFINGAENGRNQSHRLGFILIILILICCFFSPGYTINLRKQIPLSPELHVKISPNLKEALDITLGLKNEYLRVQLLVLIGSQAAADNAEAGMAILQEAKKTALGIVTAKDVALSISKNVAIGAIIVMASAYSNNVYGVNSLRSQMNIYNLEQGRQEFVKGSASKLEQKREGEAQAISEVAIAMASLNWREALELSEKIKNEILRCQVLSAVAAHAFIKGQKSEAVSIYAKAVAITEDVRDPQTKIRCLMYIASWKAFAGETKSAVSILVGCLPIVPSVSNDYKRNETKSAIALALVQIDRASGLKLINELLSEKSKVADCNSLDYIRDMSLSLASIGQLDAAMELAGKDPTQYASNQVLFIAKSRAEPGRNIQETLDVLFATQAVDLSSVFIPSNSKSRSDCSPFPGPNQAYQQQRMKDIEKLKKLKVGSKEWTRMSQALGDAAYGIDFQTLVNQVQYLRDEEDIEREITAEITKRFGRSILPAVVKKISSISPRTDYSFEAIAQMKGLTHLAGLLVALRSTNRMPAQPVENNTGSQAVVSGKRGRRRQHNTEVKNESRNRRRKTGRTAVYEDSNHPSGVETQKGQSSTNSDLAARKTLDTVKAYIELQISKNVVEVDFAGYGEKLKEVTKSSLKKSMRPGNLLSFNKAMKSMDSMVEEYLKVIASQARELSLINEFAGLEYDYTRTLSRIDVRAALEFANRMKERYGWQRMVKIQAFTAISRNMDKKDAPAVLKQAYELLKKKSNVKRKYYLYPSFSQIADIQREEFEKISEPDILVESFRLYAAMSAVAPKEAEIILSDIRATMKKLALNDKNVLSDPGSQSSIEKTVFGLGKYEKRRKAVTFWKLKEPSLTQIIVDLARTNPAAAKAAMATGPKYWQAIMLCGIPSPPK